MFNLSIRHLRHRLPAALLAFALAFGGWWVGSPVKIFAGSSAAVIDISEDNTGVTSGDGYRWYFDVDTYVILDDVEVIGTPPTAPLKFSIADGKKLTWKADYATGQTGDAVTVLMDDYGDEHSGTFIMAGGSIKTGGGDALFTGEGVSILITGDADVESIELGGCGINAVGNVRITSGTLVVFGRDGIVSEGDIEISGGARVTATGQPPVPGGSGVGIEAMKNVRISGGAVTALGSGSGGSGILAYESIIITAGTVTATGYSAGMGAGKDVVISGGDVTARGSSGFFAEEGDIEISGGAVVRAIAYGLEGAYGNYNYTVGMQTNPDSGGSIRITGGTVTAVGPTGISANGSVKISGGVVMAKATDGAQYGIYAEDEIVISGSADVAASGAERDESHPHALSQALACSSGDDKITVTMPTYVYVTSLNAANIDGTAPADAVTSRFAPPALNDPFENDSGIRYVRIYHISAEIPTPDNPTSTPEPTSTPTPSTSPTPTPSATPTPTPAPSATPTPTPAPSASPTPMPSAAPTPTPAPSATPAPDGDNTPPAPADTTPTVVTLEQPAPPAPDNGNALVDNGDGTYMELAPDGTPLGTWTFDEDSGEWIFEPIALGGIKANPKTDDSAAPWRIISLGLGLTATAAITAITRKRRNKA